MVRHDGGRQRASHPIQRPRRRGMLKAGQSRLRGQGGAGHRIAAHRQFVQRIVRQSSRVVCVLVPAGQAHNPLPQQIADRMSDLVRIPAVGQTAGQLLGQPEAVIQSLEIDATRTVGARLRLGKTAQPPVSVCHQIRRSLAVYSLSPSRVLQGCA